MQDVMNHLNEALAALRTVREVSREEGDVIRKAIAALDVTLRIKAPDLTLLNVH